MPLSDLEYAQINENPYKADYPLLAANPHISFLDSAATEQRPQEVLDAITHFYTTMNANPLRGLYKLSADATRAIEDARASIATFIGAAEGNEIVFTRNTSESLNLLAHSLPKLCKLGEGDEVLITIMEHHSNLIPWQEACKACGATLTYLYLDEDFSIPESELEKIGAHTKIVAVTHLSNVLGTQTDVAKIAKLAHAQGAYVVVDAAQSAPHIPIDVRELDCDFLALSAHKLGGPMGLGVLWGKAELLDALPPFLTGGEMIDHVEEQSAVWAPVPQKFEAGTQDAAGIYASAKAIEHLQTIGMDTVAARENLLVRYLTERLLELDYVRIVGPKQAERHIASVSFVVQGIHPHDVASILDMHDVCIRAGHHCAEPLLRFLGESSTCRASIAFYNDAADIDRLIEGLDQVWSVFNG